MRVFWREAELTDPEERLFLAVMHAHQYSAQRGNASGIVAALTATGSGSYAQALSAAILTTGALHAPLEQTIKYLQRDGVGRALGDEKIPGWGNSFHRAQPDPLWTEVDAILHADFPQLAARIDEVTASLHERGKKIFPNPSAYTAATALALGMPAKVAPYLFVCGRLEAWSHIIMQKIESEGVVWAG